MGTQYPVVEHAYLHLKLPLENLSFDNGKQPVSCVVTTNTLARSCKYQWFMDIKLNFSFRNIFSNPDIFLNINSVGIFPCKGRLTQVKNSQVVND